MNNNQEKNSSDDEDLDTSQNSTINTLDERFENFILHMNNVFNTYHKFNKGIMKQFDEMKIIASNLSNDLYKLHKRKHLK